jgi:hypothetical protein
LGVGAGGGAGEGAGDAVGGLRGGGANDRLDHNRSTLVHPQWPFVGHSTYRGELAQSFCSTLDSATVVYSSMIRFGSA